MVWRLECLRMPLVLIGCFLSRRRGNRPARLDIALLSPHLRRDLGL